MQLVRVLRQLGQLLHQLLALPDHCFVQLAAVEVDPFISAGPIWPRSRRSSGGSPTAGRSDDPFCSLLALFFDCAENKAAADNVPAKTVEDSPPKDNSKSTTDEVFDQPAKTR